MSNSRRPYRTSDHRLPLQRGPEHPLGFTRTVRGKVRQLALETRGLLDRLRYKYSDGVPAAYKNDVVFDPRTDVITVNVVDGVSRTTNIVVPDAENLSVPITMEGPGVFCARYMKVEFYQRVWGGDIAGDPHANREYRFTIRRARASFPIRTPWGFSRATRRSTRSPTTSSAAFRIVGTPTAAWLA